jgi:hypothetical protein
MENVKVRIVQKDYNYCIIEYKGKEYQVEIGKLTNVNAGWTYGYIAKVHLA